MAFGYGPGYHRLHPDLQWESLFEDDFVCLSPGKQPHKLTLADYCQAEHLYPTPWLSQNTIIDGWLARGSQGTSWRGLRPTKGA
ncbi:hypothetical protein [Chitinimonas sp. BJB300]|uniref:hypothetical protein n=1 Tax=Chitinimonas sp. BJB300 TaxID=1559339 RepID=UPI000C1243C7|nr:hypothetical protein [Chitinimonas sp. BJB300]TSJ88052.1 hypothetical protein FG002_011000 [Chitinimonas sp. BJB300]